MSARGHRQIDHTADLALEIWAPTRSALFEEAAQAVVAVLTEDRPVDARVERRVELDCADAADGLVVWLNEVLYWAVTEGFLVSLASVEVAEAQVRVSARGEPIDAAVIATELKSVTYHHLLLEQREDRWFGRVVIDV